MGRQETKRRWTAGKGFYLAGILLLVLLALPHMMDTRAGAIESGDAWLVGHYVRVAVAAVAVAAALGAMLLRPEGLGFAKGGSLLKKTGRPVRLETVFVVASLLFGMLYLYVLPPLSAPDEIRHYASAYQLSNRLLGLPATGEDGKVYVREEDWFVEDSTGEYQPYRTKSGALATDADGADGAKVLGQTLTEETYRLIHEKGASLYEAPRTVTGDEEGATGNGLALSNHLPVVTTPFGYLMPALGITLARLLGLNSLWLLYLGRIMNLLMYTAVTWLAMRRLPFGKPVLLGVGLLPMTIHLSGSFSYDAMILAGIFYLTAHCLNLAYKAEKVRLIDVLILALVMAVVGPCKMVYAVFAGLCLLIPVQKFGGRGRWALSAACVLGAWVIAMVLVNSQTVASYATETENYVSWAGEAGFTMGMLLHQPVKLFQMFYNTFLWQAEYWHLTMIGAYLGNVDVVLDVPYLIVLLLTVCLLGLTFRKPGESLVLTGGRRLWIWLLCAVCAGATMFSMLIAWTPISSHVICGVQGRYFLPFLPILLMTWKNDMVVLTKNADRSILYLMCCANAYVLMRLFSIVSMRL